jgi:hypothetical protein
MNRDELAAKLTGATYPFDPPQDLQRAAKDAGLVIVFGASDDLMEFRGAIHDELGAYDGTTAYLTKAGMLTSECEDADCPYFERAKAGAATIVAIWEDGEPYSWRYATKIPHATFEIVEDGESYCRGIVFALSDVP